MNHIGKRIQGNIRKISEIYLTHTLQQHWYVRIRMVKYSKTCLKRNRTGPKNRSAKAGFRLTRLKRNISTKSRFLTEK
jgi:hypothetical protein